MLENYEKYHLFLVCGVKAVRNNPNNNKYIKV